MLKESFLKSKYYKIVLYILLVTTIILIWRNGYTFGKWLHSILN